MFILRLDGTFMNQVSPSWSIRSCSFPRCDANIEVLQVGFEGVFVVLTLASYFPATTTEVSSVNYSCLGILKSDIWLTGPAHRV